MLKFVQSRRKRKHRNQDEDESATEDSEDNGSNSDSEKGSASDSDLSADIESEVAASIEGGLSASEILVQPFAPDIDNESITLCLICPGKQLKNANMVDVHASSAVRSISYLHKCFKPHVQ